MLISGSVGIGGANRNDDVRLIQRLLNDSIGRHGGQLLAIDGLAGPKTNAAIQGYQQKNALPRDGRIDPAGPTLKSMVQSHLASLAAGIKVPQRMSEAIRIPVSQALISEVLLQHLKTLKS